ncbi:HD domain-containing protein [Streptomyces europaeiscabiei]|uniref:HD domain-containing protein n=1 Tax=Streptomyces europaeiscabiei TaxID=146819 RepID=UPI002E2C3F97|nr:HD domain-containing protein [Streptomyces europaeiscabiei]
MKGQRRLAPFRTAQTEMPPSLESVIAVVRSHHPNANAALLERAFDEVSVWHAGQRRRSGAPCITHCLAVAAIVADLRMPVPVVCAALLHDVEDTACPAGRLTEQFGEEIAELVAAVSSRSSLNAPAGVPLATPPLNAGPSWEMTVLAIRLADRLHNMRTIAFVAPPRRHLNACETLDVFAPVARAAGLEAVGRELHDLASAVLQPAQPRTRQPDAF